MLYFIFITIVALVICALVYWRNRQWGLVGFSIVVPLMTVAAIGVWPLLVTPKPPANNNLDQNQVQESEISATHAVFESFRPLEQPSDGYVNASACAECHKDNFHSWHNSYHRTMTQLAKVDQVMGDFDSQQVTFDSHEFKMTKDDELCWVEMPTSILNLEYQAGAPPTSRLPIVMTTGSHHMQVYWFPMGKGRMLGQFPLVYLKEEKCWVPRRSCFLEPPNAKPGIEVGRWNNTCLQCHTTHPKQQLSRDFVFSTTVAEFGISCEACHGPGEKHIAFHRGSPTGDKDPIVNPDQLDHRLSAQVCGNCHAMSTHLDPETRNSGHKFRPGKSLSDTRHLYRCNPGSEAVLKKQKLDPQEFFDSAYWKDGMIRVSGREFNGLVNSPCYIDGTMSCQSCHAVHQQPDDDRPTEQWANDQLGVGMRTDQACTQCHDKDLFGEKHTHHASQSEGSRCYNCHMPHTTYGLMKAMRSHTISSPNVQEDHGAGRPNACNLCHLDQTLSWSAEHLESWYKIKPPQLTETERKTAAGVLWALRGDAGLRAIAGWHMGWKPAQQASNAHWMARYLAHLLTDPYDVVRYIAGKSLRTIPDFSTTNFDYVGTPQHHSEVQEQVADQWESKSKPAGQSAQRLLMTPEGKLNVRKFQDIANQRDDRDMRLNE